MTMSIPLHRVGAIFYVLWGVLHVFFGGAMLLGVSGGDASGVLAMLGSGVPRESIPGTVDDVTQAVLAQHAWNLLWFGVFAAVVGATLNWKNSRAGYWANLAVVSLADIGFVAAFLVPGRISMADGVMGPILWLLAVAFSTAGLRGASKTAGGARPVT
jgi:hypothetical protein